MSPTPQQPPAASQRAAATRSALITAARRLFVENGFHATTTKQVVAEAGVGTEGALFHHFSDKRALFLAVVEAVEVDLLAASGRAHRRGTAFERLSEALLGFLEASLSAEVQRILLIDGPAVLGWQQWRELEQKYGLGAIEAMLAEAVSDGSLPDQPLGAIAHLLLATVDEAALYIANAPDPASAQAEAVISVRRMLGGLTAPQEGDHA